MGQNKERGGFSPTNIPGQTKKAQLMRESGLKDFTPKINLKSVEKLPSMGKAYPQGVSIRYRPFLFGEVKQISSSKLSIQESYEYILDGVEVDGMDKMSLTVADVMYIGLLRKISTLGATEIIARYKCNHCNKPTSIVFKTDEIEFEDLQAPALPIEAEFSFGKLTFSPLTIRGYFELLKLGKEKDEVALYTMQCTEGQKEFEKVHKLLFSVDTEDARTLLEVDKYLYHSVKPLIKPCTAKVDDRGTKCGANVEIELDGGQALLMPFRTAEQSPASRLRFGVEGKC